MMKEVAVVDELQSVVALLREDLSEARQKCTMLELQVHDSENKAEDFERQLMMSKKREDMLKQNNQEMNFELEKMRETETNASFQSSNSFT